MPDRSGIDEDLPRLAAESFELSKSLCRACGQVHALWPYIRLARASTGVEAPASYLQSVLTALIAEGRRTLLIAGAADTGLLALVSRASADAGRDADIAVLDRCEAPLALCRRWAARTSQRLATQHQDLRDLNEAQRFDLVLVHGTLHFIAAPERPDVLSRLRRSLADGGRLVLLFNTSAPVVGVLARQGRDDYADWVLAELTRIAVALPEPQDAFRARLIDHAAGRIAKARSPCRKMSTHCWQPPASRYKSVSRSASRPSARFNISLPRLGSGDSSLSRRRMPPLNPQANPRWLREACRKA
jgi:SAM-dependent methyltransferase